MRSRSSLRALRSLADPAPRRRPGANRLAAPLLVGLGLAACAATPPPAAPTPPAAAPAGIEGVYRGTARLIRSDDRYCPRSGPRSYQLKNGEVTLSYQAAGRRRVPLTAPVKADGDFDVSDGVGRMQGHVADRLLTLTIASQYCEHHWTMRLIN